MLCRPQDRKLQTHCSPYLRRVGVCTKSQEEELEERNSLLTDAQIETLQSSDSTSSVGQHDTDEIATFLPESVCATCVAIYQRS